MRDGTDMLAPCARRAGLVIRGLDEELLIYDVKRERAYALTPVAGLVWKLCDGTTTVGEMPDLLATSLGEPVSLDMVWQAVSSLSDDGLLEEEANRPTTRTMTRRAMMQKVALAGSVALITSIAVPASAALAACTGTICGGGCSGTCSASCGDSPASCSGPPKGSCSSSCCATTGNFGSDSTCGNHSCCPGYSCEFKGSSGGNAHWTCTTTPNK